jgi:peptide/nickel transport system substrate-binding protein
MGCLLAGTTTNAFSDDASSGKTGDAFVTSSIGEPSNLIPFLATDSASAELSRLIFNGLLKYDKNIQLTGDLAESWEVMDGGLRVKFHLRTGVRWQDGAPFTARDVKFTYDKLVDPSTPTPYGGDFEKVKSLTVTDDHTVEVIYKEAFSPGLSSWTIGIVPEHLLKGEDLMKTSFARNPVGTGPYKLRKWVSGERVDLSANEDYFEGKPALLRYVYRIIPDQTTNFLELQTGGLDLSALTPLQFHRQTDTDFFKTKYKKIRFPSFSYAYIGYNLEDPLFSDVRVRRAVGMAIDKKEVIDVTLMGLGRVSTGPFLPGTWAYNPEVKESVFDPAAARALLESAGWKDSDGDGTIDKDGTKFSFTLITNQGNDQRRMACEVVQNRLRAVGIDVKIQVVEWGTFLREFIDKKRFQAVLLAWQMSRDPDVYDIFHSSKTAAGQFNYVTYKSAEADALLDEGRLLFDEGERATVYKKLHARIAEDEPYTFLYVPDATIAIHRRFQNVEETPTGLAPNFIRWSVEPDERKYSVRA